MGFHAFTGSGANQIGNAVKAFWVGGWRAVGFIHQEALLGSDLEGNIGSRMVGGLEFTT